MQVSVEKLDQFGRRMKVVVPAERFQQGVHSRIRELTKTVSLKGFRQGKVPTNVIEQRFGRQIRDEVLNDLVRSSFADAVRQENLRPAVVPQIAAPSTTAGDLEFTATFDVLPDFPALEVSDLKIKRERGEITDADIDRMIETLRRQRMSFNPVDRAAAAGDFVAFEFVIEADEVRVPAEGTERGLTAIGQKAVLPEIEDALVGMTAGASKSVPVSFAADYGDARLAGKAGTVSITVSRVNEAQMPAVDDAFIASFGVAGAGVDGFRREIRQNLEREMRQALSGRMRAAVVEALLGKYGTIEVPAKLIEQEAQALHRQAQSEAEARSKRSGQQVNAPAAEEFKEVAARRVLAGLLLEELARQNSLQLEYDRVRQAINTIASTYENPSEVIQLYQQDQRLLAGLQSRVMEEQVAEWVAQRAQCEDVERSFQELLQPGINAG